MSNDYGRINSRLNRPKRKKKANTILNILIGIVLLLIIVVVVNIVTSDDPKKSNEKEDATVSEEALKDELETDSLSETAENPASSTESEEKNTTTEEKTDANEQVTEGQNTSENNDSGNVITESSTEPNVEAVIVDPAWAPIGTTQTGEHTSSYDKESIDWKEKVQALAYGAGLDASNMYVKFLGNGGSPQKSIGTVTSKDGTEIYRISLEWVDGQGWKPTKKEKLTTLEDAS